MKGRRMEELTWEEEVVQAPTYDCVISWNDTYTCEEGEYVIYQQGGWNGPTYKVLKENNHVDLADIANKPAGAILDSQGFLIGWQD